MEDFIKYLIRNIIWLFSQLMLIVLIAVYGSVVGIVVTSADFQKPWWFLVISNTLFVSAFIVFTVKIGSGWRYLYMLVSIIISLVLIDMFDLLQK